MMFVFCLFVSCKIRHSRCALGTGVHTCALPYSAVLLHLVAQADPAVPVIFVDTLKMFPETLEYRETLISTFGIENSWVVTPDPDVLASKDDKGLRWSYDPDGCCEIRKVEPLARATKGLERWISGRDRKSVVEGKGGSVR